MPNCNISTAEFLQLVHGDNAVHFIGLRKDGDARKWTGHHPALQHRLRAANDDGFYICFVVNSGGTKMKQITAINAFFVDFDDQTKSEAIAILKAFDHWPTVLVETKRSIHAYWLLEEPYASEDRIEMFESVQKGLIERMGSDSLVWTPQRIMALPGYLHLKDPSAPYRVHVREVSGAVYSVGEFENMRALGDAVIAREKNEDGSKRRNKGGYKCEGRRVIPSHLYPPLSPQTMAVVSSRQEAIDHLLQVDLTQHLAVANYCCCPLHDDQNPSASIYQASSGDWLLHCHTSCGTHNIISLTANMYHESTSDAISRLMDECGLRFDDAWLSVNLAAIDETSIKTSFPVLYRSIRWYLPTLARMNEIIAENFRKHGHCDDSGRPCMMASYRYLSERLDMPLRRVQHKLSQLLGAGLLMNLRDSECPSDLHDWARSHEIAGRRASIWAIPGYTADLLNAAEAKATRRFELGETAASRSSREAQQRTYGEDEAKLICPMAKGDFRLNESHELLTGVARNLLATKGYYRDAEALEILGWRTEGGRRLVKTLRPAIISALDLVSLQLNASEKERLGIQWSGYPRVWVSRSA